MPIVAVVNQKGGTGKTTTTLNLSVALAARKQRVLAIDLDTQGNLTYSMGFMELEKSLTDVFYEDSTWSETLLRAENIDLMPANVSLADVELSMSGNDQRAFFLKDLLLPIQGQYDWILIDCPPSLSTLTLNALTAANGILIPMQLEVLSLQGLDLIQQTVAKIRASTNPNLDILGILPVMVDYRRKLSAEVLAHMETHYTIPVFSTQIRTNVKASESPSFGMSILKYAPQSNAAKDYRALAEEWLKME